MLSASPAPSVRVAPRAANTYGDLAVGLASSYGLTADDWQADILDDWLGYRGSRWTSLRCGLSVARQNGKNVVLEIRELFGMIGRGEKILHTAHQVKTAQKHFRRLKYFFGKKVDDPSANFPELNALVTEIRNVNGQEAIYLRNGASIEIIARSEGSGRGFTVDVIVCDEAQDMSDDDLEALLSTSSAGPLGDPQWIFTGTPPGPKASGEVFTRQRTAIIGGKTKKACWHEWAADKDDPVGELETWIKANPGIVSGRLLLDVIKEELSTLSVDGFRRERLGLWPSEQAGGALPFGRWLELKDPDAERGEQRVFGADVAEDRTAWVAVAWWREDGSAQVMLANDGHPMPAHKLVDESVRLSEEWGASFVPPRAFEDELGKVGVNVVPLSSAEFPGACGALADHITAGTVRHGNQPALNGSVKAALWRPAGTTGERAFLLKGHPEAGPVVAVTRALYGLANLPTAIFGAWR